MPNFSSSPLIFVFDVIAALRTSPLLIKFEFFDLLWIDAFLKIKVNSSLYTVSSDAILLPNVFSHIVLTLLIS